MSLTPFRPCRERPACGQADYTGDKYIQDANPKKEQSPDLVSAGVEKNLANVGEVADAPGCCTIGASSNDDVETQVSTEELSGPGSCPSKLAQAETVRSSNVRDSCKFISFGFRLPIHDWQPY